MLIEPAYDADGSIAAWLGWRMDQYVGSICRTKPRRWQVNDCEGAVIGVYATRQRALLALSSWRGIDGTDVQK